MLKRARGCFFGATALVAQAQAAGGFNAADALHGAARLLRGGEHLFPRGGWGGEGEFVVIAAGKRQLQRAGAVFRPFRQSGAR